MVHEVALLLGILATLFFVLRGALSYRRFRAYRDVLRIERTRTHWGEARNLLMALARTGRLDVNSETFQRLYSIQTFVLRRPDEYRAISEELAKSFLQPSSPDAGWLREAPDWPREIVDIFKKMAEGAGSLIFMHRGWRKLWPLGATLFRWTATHLSRRMAERLAQPFLSMYYIERTRQKMAQFAQ